MMYFNNISTPKLLKILKNKINSTKIQYIILDIDDTIMDTTERRYKIYNYLRIKYKLPKLPKNIFRNIYNLENIIEKFKNIDKNIQYQINKEFLNLFLSNKYLKYDRPFPGVKNFIYNVYKLGFHIIYLTGRHSEMKSGTISSFKKYNIPYDGNKILFIMKSDPNISDLNFKKEYLSNFNNSNEIVCIIDNDSEILNYIIEKLNLNSLIIRFCSIQKDIIDFKGPILKKWN